MAAPILIQTMAIITTREVMATRVAIMGTVQIRAILIHTIIMAIRVIMVTVATAAITITMGILVTAATMVGIAQTTATTIAITTMGII